MESKYSVMTYGQVIVLSMFIVDATSSSCVKSGLSSVQGLQISDH
jgi:hypothetical protein